MYCCIKLNEVILETSSDCIEMQVISLILSLSDSTILAIKCLLDLCRCGQDSTEGKSISQFNWFRIIFCSELSLPFCYMLPNKLPVRPLIHPLTACPSVETSVCLFTNLSVCLHLHMSIRLSVYPSIYLSICLLSVNSRKFSDIL